MILSNVDLVVGLGEIGNPIFRILKKSGNVLGFDIDKSKMKIKEFKKKKNYPISFLHICLPFNNKFIDSVKKISDEKNPRCIVIHSTIEPYTTEKLQKKLKIPVIYSATRGVHRRMLNDLKKYVKFFSIYDWAPNATWATKTFKIKMNKSGIKTKKISNPLTLELAKIVVDTSYYGWLINYAQISNMIAIKHNVNFDEMWSFSDEIQKYLGNRPKMFPGFIGGNCVIPNLELINEKSLYQIDEINKIYSKKVKNAKFTAKKYVKGKRS